MVIPAHRLNHDDLGLDSVDLHGHLHLCYLHVSIPFVSGCTPIRLPVELPDAFEPTRLLHSRT